MKPSVLLMALGVLASIAFVTVFTNSERAEADRKGGVAATAGSAAAGVDETGAYARAGDAVARAESFGQPERRTEPPDESDKPESDEPEEDARVREGEVALEIGGGDGVEFSGTCSVGDEETEIGGQVPERFVYEPNGRKLECEIRKEGGDGNLKVILVSGNDRVVQQTNAGTIKLAYSGNGVSSSVVSGGSSSTTSSSVVSQSSSVNSTSSSSVVQSSTSSINQSVSQSNSSSQSSKQ